MTGESWGLCPIHNIWFQIRGEIWSALDVHPPECSLLGPSCAAAVAFTVKLNMQVEQKHKPSMFVYQKNIPSALKDL